MYNLLSQVAARKLPFSGFTLYYGAAALFAKVFLFFRGFGILPKSLPQQALACEGTSKNPRRSR